MSTASGRETVRLTMAQAVVKYLQVQYSERDGETRRLIPAMFGIYGHGNVAGLGQALFEYGQDLPYYQTRNEQSMVHTASGFAKASHRLATLACTSSIGPGATNMITGAATATINRLPVLLFPSDYYATRYQGPVLQQLEHPVSADVSVNDAFRPVSRFFDRISRPEQLLTALPEAKLAREAEMCYAMMAMGTDYDCWHETEEDVSIEAVLEVLRSNAELASRVVQDVARSLPERSGCACLNAARHAIISASEMISKEVRERLKVLYGRYLEGRQNDTARPV